MPQEAELLEQVEQLRADVVGHKRAIKDHRQQLGDAKARLLAIEAECRKHGIKFTLIPGVGEIHGHRKS